MRPLDSSLSQQFVVACACVSSGLGMLHQSGMFISSFNWSLDYVPFPVFLLHPIWAIPEVLHCNHLSPLLDFKLIELRIWTLHGSVSYTPLPKVLSGTWPTLNKCLLNGRVDGWMDGCHVPTYLSSLMKSISSLKAVFWVTLVSLTAWRIMPLIELGLETCLPF